VVIAAFETTRLAMLPLQVEHAGEMAKVLSDPVLYAFIGGEPPTADALEDRYRRQLAGPGRPGEHWLNWVIQHDGELVGYVQTSITGSTAEIAWVIGSQWQGNGYGKEAAVGLVGWLDAQGIERIVAHVHPDHAASAAVTAAAGLRRTDQLDDGEYLWST
jgi:RimJ/RimL family protein N-acetyltransferase